MLTRRNLAPLLLLLAISGCQFFRPVDADADAIVVNAERADQAAFVAVDTFLQIEKDNSAFITEQLPQVHAFAETLRRDAPATFRDLRAARATYKTTRTTGDATTMEGKLQQVQNWASQARIFLAMIRERRGTS